MGGTTYPQILAGQDMTADVYNSMLSVNAWKSTATLRPSTTTLTDDPDLVLSLAAGGVYEIEVRAQYSGLDAANIQTMWDIPSDATLTGGRWVLGPASNAIQTNADQITGRFGIHGAGTAVVYSCARNSATLQQGFLERGQVTMGAAGNVALQWAQAVSNATATELCAGSIIRAWRIQ